VLQRRVEACAMTAGRDLNGPSFWPVAAGTRRSRGDGSQRAGVHPGDSGTTAAPNWWSTCRRIQVGIHTTGQWVMDLSADDVWWATSDIAGSSVIATCLCPVARGDHGRLRGFDRPSGSGDVLPSHRGEHMTGLFTSPTAVRLLMGYGTEAAHRLT